MDTLWIYPAARLVLLTKSLDVRFAVGIEELLAALLPRRLKFWGRDVPVRSALLSDDTQVLAQILHCWPALLPVFFDEFPAVHP